jgi:hypothetical protein
MTSASVLSGRLVAAALCVCAVGLLAAGTAAAAAPSSMPEAEATGDPAANAPVLAAPTEFEYKGDQISEATAVELELACLQTGSEVVCKNSTGEFDGAAASESQRGVSAPMACGVVELWLYQHKQYEGWALGYYNYYNWADIGAAYNNDTSSYRTGTASAHLSDFAQGGGYWYPGATGYCAYHSNILQVYPEWNDRISSRYRY